MALDFLTINEQHLYDERFRFDAILIFTAADIEVKCIFPFIDKKSPMERYSTSFVDSARRREYYRWNVKILELVSFLYVEGKSELKTRVRFLE